MQFKRILTHLLYSRRKLHKAFPPSSLAAIKTLIHAAESGHSGEIRFAVEAALEWPALWRGQSARERALEVFSQLHVWDTEHNNGVLVYLLLADRDVEIVADRGIHLKTGTQGWETICKEMEVYFRKGEFETGLRIGIANIADQLCQHFPASSDERNELPDQPTVL